MNPDFFSTAHLTKLFLRLCLGVLALLLLIEGILWLGFRASLHPPVVLHLNNKLPGLQQRVTLEISSAEQLRSLHWTPGAKPAGALRILCIGGQATVGQLQNAEDTWWGQLAAQLQEKLPGVPVEIGVNASGTLLALSGAKWLATFAPEWQPDLIITNLGASDVLYQPLEYEYDAAAYDRLPPARRVRAAWKESLLQVSQISRWWASREMKSAAARNQALLGAEDFYTENFQNLRTELARHPAIPNPFRLSEADPRNEYRDALKRIIATAQSAGAKLLLTGEPCLCRELMTDENAALRITFVPKSPRPPLMMVKVQSGWVERELRRFQEVAQELATEHQLTFVNLNETIPADARYFVTETMLTDLGAKEMASQLLPKVLPLVQKARAN